jgi:cell division protein ZapA
MTTTPAKKNSVKVTILDEEYMIRSDTSPEHTRAVADYVDQAIRRVMSSGTVVETQRAAILTALQIAGELFQSRDSTDELTASLRALGDEIRPLLADASATS